MESKIRPPKTSKGRKIIKQREGLIIEPVKNLIFFKSKKCNQETRALFQNLAKLRNGYTKELTSSAEKPFINSNSLDEAMRKNDSSLFFYGFSNKKNPNQITMGRYFQNKILDMVEFKFKDFKSMLNFEANLSFIPLDHEKVVSFSNFSASPDDSRLKNLFLDIFVKDSLKSIHLSRIRIVIQITCLDSESQEYSFNSFQLIHKKNEIGFDLFEIGPSFVFIASQKFYSEIEVMKEAIKLPPKSERTQEPKKVKNVVRTEDGGKVGKLYVKPQKLDDIKITRVKALKRKK